MPTPAKSTELHKLTGTKSQAQHAPSESDALEPGRPKYPKGISADARRVFKRLVQILEQRRHCTPGDEEILRLFCLLFDRHARAIAKLAEEGEIVTYYRLDKFGAQVPTVRPNLWLKVAETCEARMFTALTCLGLTPAARKGVKPTKPAKETEQSVPGDELFSRKTSTRPVVDDLLNSIDEELLQ
jgi:P27 family predicted phage terminase small subunit